MNISRYGWVAVLCAVGIGSSACDGGGTAPVDASGGPMDAAQVCSHDADCSDGSFCNGVERCDPEANGADARGCVASTWPCMPTQTCDEEEDECLTMCDVEPDADGDGRWAIACTGDDCDDSDPNRFPGNPEVCDVEHHDEDCDPSTFGYRDADMDGAPDAACCNIDDDGVAHCGTDCNDASSTTHPTAPELCDGVDNDCDGNIDEGVTETFWPDADGDGFGSSDPGAPTMEACSTPPGYAGNDRDCDDTNGAINPGNAEICDDAGLDENCDGVANPSDLCTCTGSGSRPCMLPGACASGVETCMGGSWSDCSIRPAAEVCNGTDDDCDGMTDEHVTISCYADPDEDGYAAADAAITAACGTCPRGTTDRVPSGANIDCRPDDPLSYPGATEICDRIDNDCSSGGGVEPREDEDDDGHSAPDATCIVTLDSFPKDDCLDRDARVHSGQTAYFGTPYCTLVGGDPGTCGCGCVDSGGGICSCPIINNSEESFDYDCSGTAERKAPRTGCGCAGVSGCYGDGPTVGGIACGRPTTYRTCSGHCVAGGCTEAFSTRPMQCR